MKSGAGFVRRGWVLSWVLISFLVIADYGFAQQSAPPAEPQAVSPSNLPPAQTPEDSSVKSSGTPSNPIKADEATKDVDTESSVKLGPGDLLEVGVYNVPELASKVRVSLNGDVYLPLIDYVHVEGLTQEEAQSLIEKRLSDGGFVRNPHVTIFVDEATSQGVTVIGEVSKPGIYPDVADHKLYEVISLAGGFSPNASRKLAILRRNRPDPIRIELPRNLADDQSGNVEILPGDTITVPKAPIIYVVGDVARPSGVLVDNGTLTVLQALALAGGANKTAKLGGSRLIRKSPEGNVTETKLEIKKMLEAKAPDVTLQADDILFIPVSGGKVIAARTFEATMTMATAMAIYTVHP
jgi:polysaccharide export outer membrane protein